MENSQALQKMGYHWGLLFSFKVNLIYLFGIMINGALEVVRSDYINTVQFSVICFAVWHKVAIYDVTVAYSSTFPQNERELIRGHLPGKVHFHVRRYPPSQYPSTPEGLASWCHDRWVAKEKLLEYFYTNGQFRGYDSGESIEQHGASRTWLQRMWLEICLYTVTIVWLSGSAFAVVAFVWWPFVRFVFIAQTLMFLFLWYRGSGFEVVQTSYFNWFSNKQNPKKDQGCCCGSQGEVIELSGKSNQISHYQFCSACGRKIVPSAMVRAILH